jgi:hypothetical protein
MIDPPETEEPTATMMEPSDVADASDAMEPSAVADTSAVEPARDGEKGGATACVKTIILTAAATFIAAFAWYLTDRFTGAGGQWIVKYSAVAMLMGMGTATAVIGGSGRRGAGANVAAAFAAMIAIVLGKLLIVVLTQLPQQPSSAADAAQLGRLIAGTFGYVDPLFFAVAAVGSAVRFILARP